MYNSDGTSKEVCFSLFSGRESLYCLMFFIHLWYVSSLTPFLPSFASFCRSNSIRAYWYPSIFVVTEIIFPFLKIILLLPLLSFHFTTITNITFSLLVPPFSISSLFPPHFPPIISSPSLPPPLVRQLLFKKLSCSLMVKTLANRYLHTWQNAGSGQDTGQARQRWTEREQVREKGGKNNKLTTRRPLFPQAEMDGVCFFNAPSSFILPIFQSI